MVPHLWMSTLESAGAFSRKQLIRKRKAWRTGLETAIKEHEDVAA